MTAPREPAMILAAHQPGYLPWLGYFHKLAGCDVFVISDQLQFVDDYFQHRNRMKVADKGAVWLTVPLMKGAPEERICDKRIHNDGASGPSRWQRQTWNTLLMNYGRAPHFGRYREELEDVYQRRWERLVDLDMHLLRLMLGWLEIHPTILLGSSLDVSGKKTDLILDMCRRLGATTYLSGRGGSTGYLDVPLLEQNGVHVKWQDFHHPEYPQRFPAMGFIPYLSALDLILNCGPDSRRILLGEVAERAVSVAAG